MNRNYRNSPVYLWLTWIFVGVAGWVFYGCCVAMGEAITKAVR